MAVDSYELGEGSAKAIAGRFGVCDRTMRDGLKARRAVKGRRAYEKQKELIEAIKEEYRISNEARRAREDAAWAHCDANDEVLGKMMEELARTMGGGPMDEDSMAEFANMDPMEGFEDVDFSVDG